MPTVLHLRSVLGAVALSLALAACGDDTSAPTNESFGTSFDRMWNTADREYSYFDYKGIDWGAVRAQYRPRAEQAPDVATFIGVVKDALATLKDVHVWIIQPDGRYVATYRPAYRENWSAAMRAGQAQLSGFTTESAALYHVPYGPVAYIAITSFGNGQFDVATFDRVLEQYRQASAIVIDVRMNGGGNDALAYQVAGRFTTVSRVGGYYQFRNGAQHGAFTQMTPRSVAPRGSWQFTRPVILLTGRGAFSSTEGFTSAMQALPNVTLVGDTTGGGSGNPAVFPVRAGYGFSVSRWIEYTADRQPIEWKGIAPDLAVSFSDAAVVLGDDETLTAALAYAGQAVARVAQPTMAVVATAPR
ncbi:MAG: S41 family peptidase [Gemmatimonadaceae bacterium]